MTALLHLVADDFVNGQPLASRVGTYSAIAISTGAPVDTIIHSAPAPSSTFRKSTKFGNSLVSTVDAVKVMNQPANALWPVIGKSRTYEIITRAHGFSPANSLSLVLGSDVDEHGALFAVNGQNAYSADAAFEVFGPAFDNIDTISHAAASDANYHYWALVLDFFSPSPTYSIYDADALIHSDVMPTTMSPWDVLATDTNAYVALQMADPISGSYYGEFVELMVHDTALSAARIKQRTFHFRSLFA